MDLSDEAMASNDELMIEGSRHDGLARCGHGRVWKGGEWALLLTRMRVW